MVKRFAWKTALLALVALLVLLAGDPAGTARAGPPRSQDPHLDSRLRDIADAFDAGGGATARTEAGAAGLSATDRDIRVIVQFDGQPGGDILLAHGARLEGTYGNLAQARVPYGQLRALARAPRVLTVRPPLKAIPAVTSEGVGLVGADSWQAQGLTGAGVKVAILDLGFQGYTGLLGTELPPSVTAVSYRADGDIGGGTPHGTGVAEIVHDMAPDAQLYLVNFDTEVELASASAYLTSEGVQVINASWGYFLSGPGDGTGIVDDVVTTSISNGAFWSIAAGNHARKHWSGTFTDTDSDTYHEFSPAPVDETNDLLGVVGAGQTIAVEMKWDDPWGSSCRDYDLYVIRQVGQQTQVVGASENFQHDGVSCVAGAEPWESISVLAPATDSYQVVVKEYFSSSDAFIHMMSWVQGLEYRVDAGSLLQPADNAVALTAGAVYWATPATLETFSSQGPTVDGRTKPDLVAPDGVSSATYGGGFYGTSAAAPHVAGAAALALQRSPCLGPAAVKSLMAGSAVDLGPAGPDNMFGSGRLLLGSPPADSDGDGPSDGCDNCPAWANPAQDLPLWPVPPGDDDCDGFAAAEESHVGTDPAQHCNATAVANDEPDYWPPDFNDSRTTNLSDVVHMGPSYNKSQGQPGYNQRFDLNASNSVNLSDIVLLGPYYNKTCA